MVWLENSRGVSLVKYNMNLMQSYWPQISEYYCFTLDQISAAHHNHKNHVASTDEHWVWVFVYVLSCAHFISKVSDESYSFPPSLNVWGFGNDVNFSFSKLFFPFLSPIAFLFLYQPVRWQYILKIIMSVQNDLCPPPLQPLRLLFC